jgi:thymidine kinase
MSLELILGPMFAGKTSAIQSIIRRHEALGLKCVAYKPLIDGRYGEDPYIYNHDKVKVSANSITQLSKESLTDSYKNAKLVIIEEGQFFDDLYSFVLHAVEKDNKTVIVAGLDGDRFRKPFGQLLELIPVADRITKLTSLCKLCANGTPALFSYSSTQNTDTIHVGGPESYMPLCRMHYLNLTQVG